MARLTVGVKRGWREELRSGGVGSGVGAALGPLLLADVAKTGIFDTVSGRGVVGHSGGWKCAG